ncbi:protein CutA homolog isoform X2 [Gracilinanus agilis]|uniref:protein CutA homolog isoform X2 n=1 Tax=Gracilinanus agilis TaxID=191870 RepID=UPI001CFE10FA|nr:protein CutA homolog isoform X2 [Gracilinanus agilis]
MDWLAQRWPPLAAQSCLRPGCLAWLLVAMAFLLSYPMLRTISLQVHSAVTGSYLSGTHSVAFVNCPNEQIARDIARTILDKKLAACVNILPRASSLSVHPFEIPELISLPIDQGNPVYLKWIEEGVAEN